MYEGVRIRVNTVIEDTDDFPIDIRMQKGSRLNTVLFTTVMDDSLENFRMGYLNVCYLWAI